MNGMYSENSDETSRWRSLFEHLPQAVVLLRPDYRIETLNPAAARLLQIPAPPPAPERPYALEKTPSWLLEGARQAAESPAQHHAVKKALPEGSSEQVYEIEFQKMQDRAGQLTGLIASVKELPAGFLTRCSRDEGEQRNQALFENTHTVMLLIDPATGDIVDANGAACLYYGYSHPVLVSRNICDINTLSKHQIKEEMARATTQRRSCFNFKHRLANGEIRDVEVSSGPVELRGRLLLYSIVHDVSQRVSAEKRLNKILTAVDHSPASVVITDRDGSIEYVNRKFTEITGYPPDQVLGRNPKIFKSGQTPETTYEELWQTILAGKEWQGLFHNRKRNGDIFLEQAHISPVLDGKGAITHFVAVKEDVTERQAMEAKIWRQAHFDTLTGLPNRALFFDRLGQTLNQASRSRTSAALLFIDLDHFKEVNDTYGHSKGDLLLQQVAERLSGAVRTSDTVARMGGDEFTVILQNLEDWKGVVQVAENLLARIIEPFDLGGCRATVTGSIGITQIAAGRSAEELLIEADQAMYRAKSMGRNRVAEVSESPANAD